VRFGLEGRYIAPAISAFPPSMAVKPECKAMSRRTDKIAGSAFEQLQLARRASHTDVASKQHTRPSLWISEHDITKSGVQEIW